LLFPGFLIQGQSNFGEIRGQVRDGSGGSVPNATIRVRDVGTNQTLVRTTDRDGFYVAPALRPVVYEVTAEAQGFQTAVQPNVKVDTAKISTVDFAMKVGNVSERVEVTSEAPLLQTYTGALTQTVDQKTIVEMPLNGRNTIQLALILPGVSGSPGSEISELVTNEPLPGRELSFNGGRIGGTQFFADGANTTSVALARMSVSFSPDTIQEFSVQQANYSAQYAQAGGAIINQTTKSGTNDLRGTAYWFHRQKAFTASPFGSNRLPLLNNDPRPPLRRQQLGIVVGGPVEIPKVYKGKDKTFFFFSYEPTRQLASNPGGASFSRVPTELERNGDFSQSLVYFRNAATGEVRTEPYAQIYQQFNRNADGTLTYIPNPSFNPNMPPSTSNSRYRFGGFGLFNPNDPNPARRGRVLVDAAGRSFVNPVSRRLIDALYPQPNIPFGSADINPGANFVFFRRTDYVDDRYTARIDHKFSDRSNLFFRYTDQPSFGDRSQRDPFQNGLISDRNTSRQAVATWTLTPTATTVNELRLNYVYGNFGRNFPSEVLGNDWTSEFLKLGNAGDGSPNILGYGMARFFGGGAPTAASGQTGVNNFDVVGFNSPQDVGKNVEHTYSITDDFSWVRGKWTIKAGFAGSLLMLNQGTLGIGSIAGGRYDFGRGQTNATNCSSNPIGGNLPGCTNDPLGGDSFAAFLLGVPSGLQVQTENLSNSYYYRWMNAAGYIQNDIRVSSDLTVNVGLRYQFQTPRWEKNNFQGQLNLDRLETNPFVVRNGVTTPTPAPVFEFAGVEGRSRYILPVQYLDFEPRFGFAWTPSFSWNSRRKMVVRGGWGMTHATLMGNDREPIPNIGSQTFGGFRSISYLLGTNDFTPPTNNASCGLAICDPSIPMQFGFNNAVLATDPTMFVIPPGGAIRPGDVAQQRQARPGVVIQDLRYQATGVVGDPNFRTPRIQNFNLQIEYEFMRNTVARVGYQGSRGSRLFGSPFNINREDPFTGSLPYPGFLGRNSSAIFVLYPSNASSMYHAFVAEAERRFTNGLQFRVNYTFSKNIDNASGGINFPIPNNSFNNATGEIPFLRTQNPYQLDADRSVSATHQPHIFNFVTFYELPFGPGKKLVNRGGWLGHIVGDWQMSWLGRIRSGFPVNVPLGATNSLDLGTPGGATRPNVLQGVPLLNPDWKPENALFTPYTNPRAFSFPEPGQYGNAPRYFDVAFPFVRTFDANLSKQIRPWGRDSHRRFELRAEFFNVFNLRNFEGSTQSLLGGAAQHPLLLGTFGSRTVNPNVENRSRNLAFPGVWDAILARSQGVGVDQAIAQLPGPGGVPGCPANAAEIGSANQSTALSPACTARVLSLNGSFGRLNVNNVQARVVQFALKFYF
jgi:hypothetical protein